MTRNKRILASVGLNLLQMQSVCVRLELMCFNNNIQEVFNAEPNLAGALKGHPSCLASLTSSIFNG